MKHLTIALLLGSALLSACGKDKKPAATDPATPAPAAASPATPDPTTPSTVNEAKPAPKADDKPAGGW